MGEVITTSHILSASGVELSYGTHLAVRGVDLSIARGEVVAVTGQSGSGKSSLLYCLAGVLPPARGRVRFDGTVLADLDDEEMSALRRERFGFVFQYGELLPELTVEESGQPRRPRPWNRSASTSTACSRSRSSRRC
ncbi:ATP-binding cassette domain-containing protein [Streptomyces sp. DHE7-1]|nr:ATP-binding cassette domain-containing protein [Streptomyces sp. DHE7-1]